MKKCEANLPSRMTRFKAREKLLFGFNSFGGFAYRLQQAPGLGGTGDKEIGSGSRIGGMGRRVINVERNRGNAISSGF